MTSPRRNLRNELLFAFGALSILIVGVLFAVLLTADTLQPTETVTAEAAASPTVHTAQAEVPGIMATEAHTDTPLPIDTTAPTDTLTATAADTSTPTRRATTAPPPTSTATEKAAALPTEQPSTPTAPTATHTATRRATATDTATRRPTLTPSATRTATSPPTASATLMLATPITASPTVSVTPTACPPPAGWVPYTIRSGQNLFRIALNAGVPLTELQTANCIPDARFIEAGQIIYIPPGAASGLQHGGASGSSAGVSSESAIPLQVGCRLPQVQISAPAPGTVLTAPFTIQGTATLFDPEQFNFYKVEIRREDETIFHNVILSYNPASGPSTSLASINPAEFGPGIYQIRLTVVDITGNYPEPCAIRVTFR